MKYKVFISLLLPLLLFSCEKEEEIYVPVYPQKIYAVYHEGEEPYPDLPVLYLDHMFYLKKRAPLFFQATGNDQLPFGSDQSVQNSDVQETDISVGINKCDVPVTITRVSTKSTVGKGRQIRLLPIGDSVGVGYGGQWNCPEGRASVSWSIARQFFMQDRYSDGTMPTVSDFITIGTTNKNTFSVLTDEGIVTCTGYGECRGGWRLSDYLYSRVVEKAENPFYDEDRPEENKFSLAAYLKRFRTHTDDGEPLSAEPVTDAYVSTPTHVIIQLGLNDLYNQEYKDQIASLVSRIKEEFPDMIVGLSLTDAFGTAFSKYYPDYDFSSNAMTLLKNNLHYKCWSWNPVLQQLENPAEKIFYIPNYYVQPSAESVPYEISSSGLSIPAYDTSHYHPNSNAHYAWGYQIYAWLKYTLTLI
ncbi:MAG: SGNH/GDSL hydrolase family protein [Tannerella sp.]|nr:SGNH/GDSL hydrolase family protein [Tannerella sp.]